MNSHYKLSFQGGARVLHDCGGHPPADGGLALAGQLPGGAGRPGRPRPLPGHPEARGAQEELLAPGQTSPF